MGSGKRLATRAPTGTRMWRRWGSQRQRGRKRETAMERGWGTAMERQMAAMGRARETPTGRGMGTAMELETWMGIPMRMARKDRPDSPAASTSEGTTRPHRPPGSAPPVTASECPGHRPQSIPSRRPTARLRSPRDSGTSARARSTGRIRGAARCCRCSSGWRTTCLYCGRRWTGTPRAGWIHPEFAARTTPRSPPTTSRGTRSFPDWSSGWPWARWPSPPTPPR
mmetsp:Transcript_71232/g.119174  ORF Transcript_71232/g.119174 Transcript_71232/m.119174 type:complete len:225 (+) Transcript_71232:362-1036(+)